MSYSNIGGAYDLGNGVERDEKKARAPSLFIYT